MYSLSNLKLALPSASNGYGSWGRQPHCENYTAYIGVYASPWHQLRCVLWMIIRTVLYLCHRLADNPNQQTISMHHRAPASAVTTGAIGNTCGKVSQYYTRMLSDPGCKVSGRCRRCASPLHAVLTNWSSPVIQPARSQQHVTTYAPQYRLYYIHISIYISIYVCVSYHVHTHIVVWGTSTL